MRMRPKKTVKINGHMKGKSLVVYEAFVIGSNNFLSKAALPSGLCTNHLFYSTAINRVFLSVQLWASLKMMPRAASSVFMDSRCLAIVSFVIWTVPTTLDFTAGESRSSNWRLRAHHWTRYSVASPASYELPSRLLVAVLASGVGLFS
jgi:hypothetical protein